MFVQRQGALEGTLEAFEGVDANRVKDSACQSAMSVVMLISHGCGPCGPLAPLTGTVRSGAPGAS